MSDIQLELPELYLSGLRPTTPVLTSRYASKKQYVAACARLLASLHTDEQLHRSKPGNMVITPGLFSYARERE